MSFKCSGRLDASVFPKMRLPLLVLALLAILVLSSIYFLQFNKSLKKKFNKDKVHIPKFMMELYQNKKKSFVGGDIVRSVIPKESSSGFNKHLLVFDLPVKNKNEEFLQAELRILNLVPQEDEDSLQVKLFLIEEPRNLEEIKYLNESWIIFNVTKPVEEALQKQESSIKFILQVTTKIKLSLTPASFLQEHDYPILILSYSEVNKIDNRKSRIKRSFEEDYEEEFNQIWQPKKRLFRNSCRRRSLFVKFEDIEFDVWIVQPTGYEAYQCQGRCLYPLPEHLKPTKHAIVQGLMHSLSPAKVSRTCCVPTILSSISVLYVDSEGVLTYQYSYKDMVVKECGCR